MSIGIGVSFIFNKLGGGGTPPNPDFAALLGIGTFENKN
jgi:hypothetical protein